MLEKVICIPPSPENEIPDGPGMATKEEAELMKAAEALPADNPESPEVNPEEPIPVVIPIVTAKKKFRMAVTMNTFLLSCLAGLTLVGFLVVGYQYEMNSKFSGRIGAVSDRTDTIQNNTLPEIRKDLDGSLKRVAATETAVYNLSQQTTAMAETNATAFKEINLALEQTATASKQSTEAANAAKAKAEAVSEQLRVESAKNALVEKKASAAHETAVATAKTLTQVEQDVEAAKKNTAETIGNVTENVATANQKADRAILAGETAASAVGIIADKPTKAIGHSVGKRTKEEVKAALRSYWDKYDNRAAVDAK